MRLTFCITTVHGSSSFGVSGRHNEAGIIFNRWYWRKTHNYEVIWDSWYSIYEQDTKCNIVECPTPRARQNHMCFVNKRNKRNKRKTTCACLPKHLCALGTLLGSRRIKTNRNIPCLKQNPTIHWEGSNVNKQVKTRTYAQRCMGTLDTHIRSDTPGLKSDESRNSYTQQEQREQELTRKWKMDRDCVEKIQKG